MSKTQIFVLVLVFGLAILGVVAYFVMNKVQDLAVMQAKKEIASEGFKEVKDLLGRFKQQP